MANIFSGILGSGGSAGSGGAQLAQYKQQLDEYELKRAHHQRQQDLATSQDSFETSIKDMSPERQAQARYFLIQVL